MKKLIMGAALATLLASPAFAQSYSADFGTGNVLNVPAAEAAGGFGADTAGHAYAYAPARGSRAQAMSPSDPDTVYNDGHYVGRDPDPNVRLELRRDSGMYN